MKAKLLAILLFAATIAHAADSSLFSSRPIIYDYDRYYDSLDREWKRGKYAEVPPETDYSPYVIASVVGAFCLCIGIVMLRKPKP
jgi:hypothetical protein